MGHTQKKEELVLTPGGYRRKKLVKHVGPNEAIRRMEDGTYAVVSREEIPMGKSKSMRNDR